MEEQWKEYYGYKVSNYGRVVNKHGRVLHPICGHNGNYRTVYYTLSINKQRRHTAIAPLVAKLFCVKNEKWGRRIYVKHIDGDYRNNRADNLKIAEGKIHAPTEFQRELYEKEVVGIVRSCFSDFGLFRRNNNGFDLDNALGQAYLDIWVQLPCYKRTTKKGFYGFCRRICWFVLCAEYKKLKQRNSHEISIDQLFRKEEELYDESRD